MSKKSLFFKLKIKKSHIMKVGILKIFDLIVCLRHKTSFFRHKLKTTYIFWTVNEIEVCSLERWIFCWQFCYSFHQNFKLYYLIHFANHAHVKGQNENEFKRNWVRPCVFYLLISYITIINSSLFKIRVVLKRKCFAKKCLVC